VAVVLPSRVSSFNSHRVISTLPLAGEMLVIRQVPDGRSSPRAAEVLNSRPTASTPRMRFMEPLLS
jgi:hypothetical protein